MRRAFAPRRFESRRFRQSMPRIETLVATHALVAIIAFSAGAITSHLRSDGGGADANENASMVGTTSAPSLAITTPAPDPAFALAVAILEVDEGFRGGSYEDTVGRSTIGYGTALPLTKPEGAWLLRHRLRGDVEVVLEHWPGLASPPVDARARLYAGAYQLGPGGLLGFTELRMALDQGDYRRAAAEALASKWDTQTPHRAVELADALRNAER